MYDPMMGDRDIALKVVCTTPWKTGAKARHRAQITAAWFNCPVVPRRDRSVANLLEEEDAQFLIVADQNIQIYVRSELENTLAFHPGMAMQRILGLRQGGTDRLILRAGIRPGDRVMDATFGMGWDSLVLAEAVGREGTVLGIESSRILERLFTCVQKYPNGMYPAIENLLPRIHLLRGDHLTVLKAFPNDFVDVVYFDPMFRLSTRGYSAAMDSMRTFTNGNRLSQEAWLEARRVARRCVILKERPHSGEFERFGLLPDKPRASVAFGVWEKGANLH